MQHTGSNNFNTQMRASVRQELVSPAQLRHAISRIANLPTFMTALLSLLQYCSPERATYPRDLVEESINSFRPSVPAPLRELAYAQLITATRPGAELDIQDFSVRPRKQKLTRRARTK